MNSSSPITVIFSCDDNFIERIKGLLGIIEITNSCRASDTDELESLLGEPTEHRSGIIVILDTLYAERSVCELIRTRLDRRDPIFCICTCERSDKPLFGDSGCCLRLEQPYTVNEFFAAYFRAVTTLNSLPPEAPDANRERETLLCVSEFLRDIGVPAHLGGCELLRCALCMTIKEPALLQLITKDLYVRLAKKFTCSQVSVERSIRRTLDVSWKRGCMDAPELEFSHYIKEKPTNSEFLFAATEYLRKKLGKL